MAEMSPWLREGRVRVACGFSQWYITQEQKPWEPGVYQILKLDGISTDYAYWDGAAWGLNHMTQEAAASPHARRSTIQNKRWRGLAKNPETVSLS